jgi:Ricin-type beta-trefoil lectin domain
MRLNSSAVAAVMTAIGIGIFSAVPTGAAVLSTGAPNGPYGGYACADVAGANIAAETRIQAWDCHAGPNQQYQLEGITIYALGGQRCMDVAFAGTADGTIVWSYPCNGTGAQQWYYYRGQLVNIHAGKCLDAGNATNGTQLVIRTCNSSNSQQWQIK